MNDTNEDKKPQGENTGCCGRCNNDVAACRSGEVPLSKRFEPSGEGQMTAGMRAALERVGRS